MNKDDQELFKSFTKRVHFPMVIDTYPMNMDLVSSIVSVSFRADAIWENFYPVNQDKMVVPFKVDGYFYALEVDPTSYDNSSDETFIKRIKNEVKKILSEKEQFYFMKLKKDQLLKDAKADLKKSVSKENPKWKLQFTDVTIKNKKYIIAGKDRAQLARTIIYIANKK
jgi:hypothetical protein